MKIALLALAALFSLPILLIAGFQLIRQALIELSGILREAWHSADAGSAG